MLDTFLAVVAVVFMAFLFLGYVCLQRALISRVVAWLQTPDLRAAAACEALQDELDRTRAEFTIPHSRRRRLQRQGQQRELERMIRENLEEIRRARALGGEPVLPHC